MCLKCIIFDMDGLMFDTERINGECFKRAAKEYGYIVTDEIRLKLLGRSKKANHITLMNYFGQDYPAQKISQLSLEYKDLYIKQNGLPIKKGLKELLSFLKKKKIYVAVASSSNDEDIFHYLKISHTIQYIDYVIAGNQVHQSKPNPEIFINVLNHFHLKASEAIILEDSENGILAANQGKIPVICIPDLVHHSDDINQLTLVVLDNLNNVIEYLEKEMKI